MTTATVAPAAPAVLETDSAGIAPDDALVINLRDLGVTATGSELEKLFVKFANRNSGSSWQYELTPAGEIVAMAPINHPGGWHENDTATELNIWARGFGGMATGANAFYRMPVTGGAPGSRCGLGFPAAAGRPPAGCRGAAAGLPRFRRGNPAPAPTTWRRCTPRCGCTFRTGRCWAGLLTPRNRRVYIYRAGRPEPETVDNPAILSGEEVLPGFTFEVARWIFDRA